jgi:hypothetical protein
MSMAIRVGDELTCDKSYGNGEQRKETWTVEGKSPRGKIIMGVHFFRNRVGVPEPVKVSLARKETLWPVEFENWSKRYGIVKNPNGEVLVNGEG